MFVSLSIRLLIETHRKETFKCKYTFFIIIIIIQNYRILTLMRVHCILYSNQFIVQFIDSLQV